MSKMNENDNFKEIEAEKYIELGAGCFEQEKYEESIENYEKALKLIEDDENKSGIYGSIGVVFSQQGKYKESMEKYKKALDLTEDDENKSIIYIEIGEVFRRQEKYEESIENYEKALDLTKDDKKKFIVYNIIGLVFSQQGKYEKSIKKYKKALDLTKDDEKKFIVYNRIGIAFRLQGKLKESIKNYEEALKSIEDKEKKSEIYRNIGVAFCEQGKYKESVDNFEKSIYISEDKLKCTENYRLKNFILIREALNKKTLNEKILNDFLDKIYKEIFKLKNPDILGEDEIEDEIYELGGTIEKILSQYIFDIEENDIIHYTKINTVKNLFSNNSSKFRLYNSIYMNDPKEGELFKEILVDIDEENSIKGILDKIFGEKDKDHRKIINKENDVYLASFSEAIDRLPMWISYSDKAKGCGLVFDNEFFGMELGIGKFCLNRELTNSQNDINSPDENKANDESYIQLQRIEYIDSKNIKKELNKKSEKKLKKGLEDLSSCLKEIFKKVETEDEEKEEYKKLVLQIRTMLDCLRFIFKDKQYEYEEEIRIIKTSKENNIDEENATINIPRLYIEIERKMKKCKEVIVGVNCTEKTELATYIYKKVGKEIDVTVSSIAYK